MARRVCHYCQRGEHETCDGTAWAPGAQMWVTCGCAMTNHETSTNEKEIHHA